MSLSESNLDLSADSTCLFCTDNPHTNFYSAQVSRKGPPTLISWCTLCLHVHKERLCLQVLPLTFIVAVMSAHIVCAVDHATLSQHVFFDCSMARTCGLWMGVSM